MGQGAIEREQDFILHYIILFYFMFNVPAGSKEEGKENRTKPKNNSSHGTKKQSLNKDEHDWLYRTAVEPAVANLTFCTIASQKLT
jgi:hypothetical protein